MELFRAGGALLRCSQALSPFFAPAACRTSTTRTAAPIVRHCGGRTTSRAFTSTQHRREEGSPGKHPPAIGDDIASLVDDALDLDGRSPTAPTSRTSRFSSRNAQQNNPPSESLASEPDRPTPVRTSVDDFLDHVDAASPRSSNREVSSSHDDISRMLDPNQYLYRPGAPPPEIEEGPRLKLGPSLGRTVLVNPMRGMDVGRAFRTLEVQCARNSVKRDFMQQRFHERPGLKRKRLKSMRWRRNFKEKFKKTVNMVQKMTRQGW